MPPTCVMKKAVKSELPQYIGAAKASRPDTPHSSPPSCPKRATTMPRPCHKHATSAPPACHKRATSVDRATSMPRACHNRGTKQRPNAGGRTTRRQAVSCIPCCMSWRPMIMTNGFQLLREGRSPRATGPQPGGGRSDGKSAMLERLERQQELELT